MEEQHVYHHTESSVNVKVEKNSNGFNYEVSVHDAKTVDEAMAILKDAEGKLKAQYGETPK
jgi:hypothetical protein